MAKQPHPFKNHQNIPLFRNHQPIAKAASIGNNFHYVSTSPQLLGGQAITAIDQSIYFVRKQPLAGGAENLYGGIAYLHLGYKEYTKHH